MWYNIDTKEREEYTMAKTVKRTMYYPTFNEKKNEFDIYIDNFGVVWANDDFEHRERHISLHIRNICRDLCNAAEIYFQEHSDEFEFVTCKIVQIDPDAKHPWEYSKTIS